MSWSHPIWPRFLPTKTVMALATVGPAGRLRPGPGTWGSVAGLLYQLLFFHQLGLIASIVLILLSMWFAIGICGEAEFRLGRRDPSEVVLDEFVAMPVCFLGWPGLQIEGWPPVVIFVTGFLLFRLFDITKPFGISRLQDLPGGWGVVIDDIAAALVSCGVMHGAVALWRYYHPAVVIPTDMI